MSGTSHLPSVDESGNTQRTPEDVVLEDLLKPRESDDCESPKQNPLNSLPVNANISDLTRSINDVPLENDLLRSLLMDSVSSTLRHDAEDKIMASSNEQVDNLSASNRSHESTPSNCDIVKSLSTSGISSNPSTSSLKPPNEGITDTAAMMEENLSVAVAQVDSEMTEQNKCISECNLTESPSGTILLEKNIVCEESGAEKHVPGAETKICNVDLPISENPNTSSVPQAAADVSSCSVIGALGGQKKSKTSLDESSVYHIKWVMFHDTKVPIITQNENGPCPLIAIMNVLLLQSRVKFPNLQEMVTSNQVMGHLGECLFDHVPKDASEVVRLNYERNMHDAMAVFHKLQTGLDVNVRFTGVSEFEYTSECIVFDLLSIPLYHGWLVDPEEPELVAAVSTLTYNQLVEKVIEQKHSSKEELQHEAWLCENFLDASASQLTYHGLCELNSTLKDGNLAVFFRNNHFSTLYKHNNELFLLVTDQGFLTEHYVVWETLSNVEGDSHFVDSAFKTYQKPAGVTPPVDRSEAGSGEAPGANTHAGATHGSAPEAIQTGENGKKPSGSTKEQRIDHDYMVALSLQEGHVTPADEHELGWRTMTHDTLSDYELARQLQEEENERLQAPPPAAPVCQENPTLPTAAGATGQSDNQGRQQTAPQGSALPGAGGGGVSRRGGSGQGQRRQQQGQGETGAERGTTGSRRHRGPRSDSCCIL